MATQALYRKWRPRTFDEVVDQAHVTRTLRNALANDRVVHAYLFAGPRGTGKTTTARLLAKAVNCLGEGTDKPCGRCHICQAVDEGRLMDLIEIDAASNRGIDEIRDLRDKVGFKPAEARVKFYIIDEAHMLTDPAFNALLKTLEEPPPHVIFVLATTEPHKIPPTIVSRCQRFDFRRIPLSEMVSWLAHIAGQENLAVEPAALEYIARQGGGSLRDAISLLDQLTSYGSERISVAQVRSVLGAVTTQAVTDLVNCLTQRDAGRGLGWINHLVEDGADPRQFTRELVDYLRRLLLLKVGDGANLLRGSLSDEELATMQQQAGQLTARQLLRMARLFHAAALETKSSFLPQLPLELALVEALADEAAPEPAPAVPAAPPRPAAAVPAPPPVPAAPPRPAVVVPAPPPVMRESPPPEPAAPSPAAPEPEGPLPQPPAYPIRGTAPIEPPATSPSAAGSALSLAALQEHWRDILSRVRQVNKTSEGLMRSVVLVGVERNTVIVEAPSELLRGRIEQPSIRSHVEPCISQVVGIQVRLQCVVKGEYQPSTPAAVSGEASPRPEPASTEGDQPRARREDLPPGPASAAVGVAGPADRPPEMSAGREQALAGDPMIEEAMKLGGKIGAIEET